MFDFYRTILPDLLFAPRELEKEIEKALVRHHDRIPIETTVLDMFKAGVDYGCIRTVRWAQDFYYVHVPSSS